MINALREQGFEIVYSRNAKKYLLKIKRQFYFRENSFLCACYH